MMKMCMHHKIPTVRSFFVKNEIQIGNARESENLMFLITNGEMLPQALNAMLFCSRQNVQIDLMMRIMIKSNPV